MVKRNKWRAVLALLLAAAMALTGPMQSAGLVRAEETVVQESAESSDVERESADGNERQTAQIKEAEKAEETAALETQTVDEEAALETPDTAADEMQHTELSKETQPSETMSADASAEEAQSVTETIEAGASDFTQEQQETVEETTQEATCEEGTTQEETIEEETTQEEDALKISGTAMNNAIPLSIGRNEIKTIKKNEPNQCYYFEPKEDGAYYVRLDEYEYDCILKKSGVKKSLYDREEYDEYESEELFIGKAGERVYFQPCFDPDSWYYDEEEEYENQDFTTSAVIEVRAAVKGTVSKESDGTYTLSYASGETNVNGSLAVNALNTAISLSVRNKDKTDDRWYGFYVHCDGETYGKSRYCSFRENADSALFDGLDMDETYHIDYVLLDYVLYGDDDFVWFEGMDLTTANTDRVGGVITNITAGFADIVVDYELFHMDATRRSAYIRYKKDGTQEWDYYDVDISEAAGSRTISNLEEETKYLVELVGSDKKTVYDSRQVTTGKYEGKVTASVKQDSITSQSAEITITGYDTKDDTINCLEVRAQYTDDWNGETKKDSTFWSSDEAFQSGTVTLSLNDLVAGTEYKNVKVSVLQIDRQWKSKGIYAGTLSFTTKESSIKTENISTEIVPDGYNRATLKVEVKDMTGPYQRISGRYRQKGETTNWHELGYQYVSGSANTVTWNLYNLEEADYELQFNIGGAVTKVQECHFTPFTDDVKAEVKVKNTFVNGLEIEAALTGVEANDEDLYTCQFQVEQNRANGSVDWDSFSEITLDVAKPVTKQIAYWNVHPGEKRRWRYVVRKNYSICYIGYLDSAQTQTKPLELDVLSVESDAKRIWVSCKVKNWSEVIKDDEYNEANIAAYAFVRKKGEGTWKTLDEYEYFDFYFDKDGTAKARVGLYIDDGYMTLDPSAQYELCMASSTNDDHVVYAQTTFIPTASWEIAEENSFVYNSANTRRSIAISGNYNKPTVEVENENIVSVREIRQSRIYLDVHNVGFTTLDVTADGVTKTINVTVTPSAETLFFFEGADESLKDTVRLGSSEGARLSYEEREGNRVTAMAVSGTDKLETVQHEGDLCWYLRATNKANYAQETTEQVTLKITTQNEKTYEQAITVTILPEPKITVDADTSTGTITFSQTEVPNLFYVNSEAVFSVTNGYKDYEIEDIRTIEKDKDAQNFHVKRYNAKTNTITLIANKLDSSTVAAYTAKNSSNTVANVEVKFKGYDGYYPKDGNGIKFAVAVQNKPVSALKAEDAFVTGSVNTAQVDALDKKTVFDLSGSVLELVSAKTKAEGLTATVENGSLKLTQTGAKGGKYTLNVTNPNWTKTLTLTGKISKVDVAKLTMKASKTKATLNTKYNDRVAINLSVKGNASLPVVIETEVKPVSDALAIVVSEDNKHMTLGVAEGKTLAAGKYTISVVGKIGEEKTKATKLTLTVTDKEPEVKLSAKGSINILNRDLSGITYTAAVKNTDADIKSVEITGDSVLAFKLVKGNGKTFVLKAQKNAASIDTKKKYEVKVKLTLSNGAVIKDNKSVTLKVKPTDKLPKVKINAPKKPMISKTAQNGVAVKLDMEAGYRIAKVELDGKDKDKFTAASNEQSAFTINLAQAAGEIPAGTYSIKYKIYFDGANTTTKQMTKSIKITVTESNTSQ